MRKSIRLLLCILMLAFPTACGTIIHGSTQSIGIASNPSAAAVRINGEQMGMTPVALKLDRDKDHAISVQLPGYEPYSATVTHSVTGWVWGNIAFGGIIGLAVDAISGGLYTLDPEQVSGDLKSKLAKNRGDELFIAVVLKPEDGWKRVGTLERLPGHGL